MKDKKFFIVDFDSTFIRVEALEELAAISLKNNREKDKIMAEIERLTKMGMEGKIPFYESITKRIQLLNANRTHLDLLIRRLKRKVSTSIKRNKEFFKKYSEEIYIVSGGFKEFIVPIVEQFNIAERNVFSNTFIFDDEDNIIGFDTSNILAQKNGKVELLKSLQLNGDIYVIGDGYTDYQIKEAGLSNKFYLFTENIQRDSIFDKADHVTPSFDEFLYINKLPMAISYPKNRINVLLLENIHVDALKLFNEEGYHIETSPKGLDEDELSEKIKNVSILGVRSKTRVTKKILTNANRLMTIGTFCIGTDQIDLAACLRKGIAVFNAPFSNTRSVVELAIGEMIMLIRKIFDKSTMLHKGTWNKSCHESYEIRGKRLGIVGYGKIGSQLSVLAESLGMEVYFYDIIEKLIIGNAKKCSSLRELLKKVDIVSIHVDGKAENHNLISEQEFRIMRDGVIFLNMSRGFVVDIQAIVKYIKNGKIAGAAIDVFPEEPIANTEIFISELQNLPNVILTPHIGGNTIEAQKNIAAFLSHKIIDYVNSGNSEFSVNFPNIYLPQLQKVHRLIHIHENIPGMLAKINNVLATYNINIEGQYLGTNKEIGYAITDISKKYNHEVIDNLKQIPNTIKFRILY